MPQRPYWVSGTMILYASYTRGARSLDALRASNFRLLVTPEYYRSRAPYWSDGSPAPYALDNGAYGCHKRGEPFNWPRFDALADGLGDGADWIVAPDILGGGLESLAMSVEWLKGWDRCPVLIAVQDGMRPLDVRPHLSPRVGIAVGGTTEFKEQTMVAWGRLAHEMGIHLHALRVNTLRRLKICRGAGVVSVDGSRASKFAEQEAALIKQWADALSAQQTLGVW